MRIIKRSLIFCLILFAVRIAEIIILPIILDDEPYYPATEPEPPELQMPTYNGPLRDPFRPDHPTREEARARRERDMEEAEQN